MTGSRVEMVSNNQNVGQATSTNVHSWTAAEAEPHEQTSEIIRQVEYYLGDENLPHDAHLLARAGGDGNGPVSINELLSFPKMRQFKPRARVIASLRQSHLLEVVSNKLIKRRHPLTAPLAVTPKLSEGCEQKKPKAAQQKPWLTKGMMKPTGFEEYATHGPIKPEEYAEERKLFNPEEAFIFRIENAVNRYVSKRKMHQLPRAVFEKFIIFGGFTPNKRPFTGGLTNQVLEDYTKDEIAYFTASYHIAQMVKDEFDEDEQDQPKWTVDFETIAKAFLSSQLLDDFEWYKEETMRIAINVPRNFYNYLLYHDVCPEYRQQIFAARAVCDFAEKELLQLSKVDQKLPGDFNSACSALHQGHFAGSHRDVDIDEEWTQIGDNMGWSNKDAWAIFATGVAAYGSEKQLNTVEQCTPPQTQCTTVYEESCGLEVIGMEFAEGQVKEFYAEATLANSIIRPMGRLHCVRWNVPHAPPEDLSAKVIEEKKAKKNEKLEFLLNEDILINCYKGMKMDAAVKELDLGIKWIDFVEAVYPSYFTWTANERIHRWKEPGPPKERTQGLVEMGVGSNDAAEIDNKDCEELE